MFTIGSVGRHYQSIYWPSVGRLSTDCLSTMDQLSINIVVNVVIDTTYFKYDPKTPLSHVFGDRKDVKK